MPLLPFRSVVRLGSRTELPDTTTNGGARIEINTIQAVKNSADKALMKERFEAAGVKTAKYVKVSESNFDSLSSVIGFPMIIKNRFSSRGEGIYLIESDEQLRNWKAGKTLSNYIAEKYHNYNKEFRLHVTRNGCFYTCRKMLRSDVPESDRWYRNDTNCVWIVEDNKLFDKPTNWDKIVEECVKALQTVGLDVGACDVKVQTSVNKDGKKRKSPEFIVIEINSAPSFGNITKQRYVEVVPMLLKQKFLNQ